MAVVKLNGNRMGYSDQLSRSQALTGTALSPRLCLGVNELATRITLDGEAEPRGLLRPWQSLGRRAGLLFRNRRRPFVIDCIAACRVLVSRQGHQREIQAIHVI